MKKLRDILVRSFAQGHTANHGRAQTLAPGATLVSSFPTVVSVEEINRTNVIEKRRGGDACPGIIMALDWLPVQRLRTV